MNIHKLISIILIIATVVLLTSYNYERYLKSFSQSPSKEWSRDIKIGSRDFNRSTSIFSNNNKIYAILPKMNKIELIDISTPNKILIKDMDINGIDESNVKEINYCNGRLYIVKNNTLMSVGIDGSNLVNYGINADGFKIVDDKLITFNNSEINIYKISNDKLMLEGSISQIKNTREIDAEKINKRLYIALLTGINYDRSIYLLTYDGRQWGNLKPVYNISVSSFSDIDNLRIAYDGGIYLFYNSVSKNNLNLKYIYFKDAKLQNVFLKDAMINVDGIGNADDVGDFDILESDTNVYVVSSAGIELTNFGTTPIKSTEIIYSKWKNGKIESSKLATRTGTWAGMPKICSTKYGNFLTWIESDGFGKYDVYASSTTYVYKNVLNRVRPVDKQYALSTLIQKSAASLLIGLILVLALSLPAYVLFVIIMLFEPKRLKNDSIFSFYIGTIVYMIMKYFFYPPHPVKMSLNAVFGPYSLIVMPFIFTLISLGFVKIYYGKGKFNSNFGAFSFMIIIDAILTNLFYAPFFT
ncbi:hypothetical protein [Thermoanaerobacterium thermosaccharolyticum]|uniref:hypothetical protein n=1 Tax=Thermoanaerobacterium thermosaccharolyticum TaxID=1517 RepID=UPI00123C5A63|nr:hypothetical protein [Thermoanaerobacterium thermosaccharolyticum]KAA5808085.1 hypothetical protein F1655_02950 [Thermoanaerobacterium thermosaccharolyticum]